MPERQRGTRGVCFPWATALEQQWGSLCGPASGVAPRSAVSVTLFSDAPSPHNLLKSASPALPRIVAPQPEAPPMKALLRADATPPETPMERRFEEAARSGFRSCMELRGTCGADGTYADGFFTRHGVFSLARAYAADHPSASR